MTLTRILFGDCLPSLQSGSSAIRSILVFLGCEPHSHKCPQTFRLSCLWVLDGHVLLHREGAPLLRATS